MSAPRLLTLTAHSIPGGMETYSQALRKAVPGLEVQGRESLPSLDGMWAKIAQEAAVSKAFAAQLEGEKDPPSLLFSNGIMGAYLDWVSPRVGAIPRIAILHGTFTGLADHAYSRFDPVYWRMRWGYGALETHTFQSAHACIANSPFTAREAFAYHGVNPRVVEPPIDGRLFSPGKRSKARDRLGWSPDEKHMVFVGNPTRSKGFDIVLALAREHPEWVFDLICVPAPRVELQNVRVHAPRPLGELAHFYRAADAVVFPSRYEGFGFVPLEALACGAPVVAGNVGILPSINASHLTRTEMNVPAFSGALKKIIANPPKAITDARSIPRRFTGEAFKKGIRAAMKEAREKGNRA